MKPMCATPLPDQDTTGGSALPGHSPALRVCEVSVEGMTCAHCSARVERALHALPGVVHVEVSLPLAAATISFRPGAFDAEAVCRAVEHAGYRVPAAAAGGSGDSPTLRASAAASAVHRRAAHEALRSAVVALIGAGVLDVLPMWYVTDHQTVRWLTLAVGTLVPGWAGAMFLRAAWPALRVRSVDMNVLVSIGVISAWLYSAVTLLRAPVNADEPLFFESAAMVVGLVQTGRYLSSRAQAAAADQWQHGVSLSIALAHRLSDAGIEDVAAQTLAAGDEVLVRPGERIPVDGEVLEGSSGVDESILTGEPTPMLRRIRDRVIAGSLNTSGSLRVLATATGDGTIAAGIERLMHRSQSSRLPLQAIADQWVERIGPLVILAALCTGLGWLLLAAPAPDQSARALSFAVSVLIVTCPCAIGLAVPLAVAVTMGRAARAGVLFRDAASLQALARVDRVAFDKTGTLTQATPQVLTLVTSGPEVDPGEMLLLAASLERYSEHPLARAIEAEALRRGLGLRPVLDVSSTAGQGIEGWIDGRQIRVGMEAWAGEGQASGAALPDPVAGASRIAVHADGRRLGCIDIGDALRETAPETLRRLHALGVRTALISGDDEAVCALLAGRLGIEFFQGRCSPAQKLEQILAWQALGERVAFVGDGVNDAPAIAQANAGIALGGGAGLANRAAGIQLLAGRDFQALADALEISRSCLRIVRQNLFWAFFYNALLIPVASGVFYPAWGIRLTPAWASAAMGLSSLFVVANSMRLRRWHP